MRRFLGTLTLAVGASLILTTTVSANDPEGRVVNAKPKRPIKRLVDPAPAEPTPTEATPTEGTPAPATPTESTPAETPRTEVTPADATPTEGNSSVVTDAVEGATDPAAPAVEGTVTRTFEEIQITEEEKRRAAAGKQQAAAEEQQLTGRIRGLQLLIAKEEQLLAQRLAYASKLREKGLATNDPKTLTQAEQFERAALAEYQKKVQQFERASVTNSMPEQPRRAPQPPRTSKNPSAPRR